jgi:apolipoprotein N-acyltransferase
MRLDEIESLSYVRSVSNGDVLDKLEWYTADAMVQNVPLIEGNTPATGFGLWFDGLNAAIALSFLALGIRRKR